MTFKGKDIKLDYSINDRYGLPSGVQLEKRDVLTRLDETNEVVAIVSPFFESRYPSHVMTLSRLGDGLITESHYSLQMNCENEFLTPPLRNTIMSTAGSYDIYDSILREAEQ